MNKIMEEITVSNQVFPTTTSAISGSVAVDMSVFRNAVGKLYAHRLPDAKGEGVITLSLYENVGTGVTGSIITASTVTGAITSASDVYLETEITSDQLSINSTKRYVYAKVTTATGTVLGCTIERANPRLADV